MWWPAIDWCYVWAFGSWVVSLLFSHFDFMPSVNGFAELTATLVSELGCHVGIHFKRVEFKF